MTLQQLEYIIALHKTGSFNKAAEQCQVTQPTLSLMIRKLEDELDLVLFDRSKKPIRVSPMGEKIIKQAEKTILEASKIEELVLSEISSLERPLKIGIIPTVSAYLIPNFIKQFKQNYPKVELSIFEMTTQSLINALEQDTIDCFIAATPLEKDNLLEVPLYYEKFVAYFASSNTNRSKTLSADAMPSENLWTLKEGHCLRDQTFNFCKGTVQYNHVFEAGNLETLVNIVDQNGGYSIIPELYVDLLSNNQKENIYEINQPPAVREVSIIIKSDFIKERLINAVADTVKKIIPLQMLDNRLKKFAIKL